MRSVVEVNAAVADQLAQLAQRERRTPQAQLQWVIDHHLAGWLTAEAELAHGAEARTAGVRPAAD